MIEALQYTFVQNALIAAVLVSIVAGIIGSLILVNKMTRWNCTQLLWWHRLSYIFWLANIFWGIYFCSN